MRCHVLFSDTKTDVFLGIPNWEQCVLHLEGELCFHVWIYDG